MFEAVSAILPASDVSRARDFYENVLGLEAGEERPSGSIHFSIGDGGFELYQSEYAGTNKATAIGFEVPDIVATVATLRSKGIEFQDFDYGEVATVDGVLTLPDGSKGAWFSDTEGNIVGVVERV